MSFLPNKKNTNSTFFKFNSVKTLKTNNFNANSKLKSTNNSNKEKYYDENYYDENSNDASIISQTASYGAKTAVDVARKSEREKEIQKYIKHQSDFISRQVGKGPTEYRSWFYGYERPGVDWCTLFVNWIFNHGGKSELYVLPIYDSGLAGEAIVESMKYGYGTWHESEYTDSNTVPKEGDVVCFNWFKEVNGELVYDENAPWGYDNDGNKKEWKWITPQGSDHVGYVYKVDDEYIYTIEGNTGSDYADEATVTKKVWKRDDIRINGYYRPNYENAISYLKEEKNNGD